jgi:hypothetical protein
MGAHKHETFVGFDFEFVLFCIQYGKIIKFCKKKIDLAIIQEDTIFPRIRS